MGEQEPNQQIPQRSEIQVEENDDEDDFWLEFEQNDALVNQIQSLGTSFVTYLHSMPNYNREMVVELIDTIEGKLLNPLTDIVCESIKTHISGKVQETIFNNIKKAATTFGAVRTEYKLLKFLQDKNLFELPILDEIDAELEPETTADGTAVTIVEKPRSNVYIDLQQFFKKMFSIEKNLQFMLDYMQKLSSTPSSCIDNFIKGKFWQSIIKNYKGKICIPYFIFADSFEVNNPLGSKAGKQALTGYYLNFPALPRHISGRVENHFLIQFAYSAVEKVYTNEQLLNTLINDIIYLQNNPIILQLDGEPIEVYFLFGGLRGDNLGLNSILDYSKSFKAKHFCRICSMDSELTKRSTRDDETLYRTKRSYEEALTNEDSLKEAGIHRNSVFNKIPGLHITDIKSVDAMHDYFEGYAHDAIIACLKHFMDEEYFTLEELNEYIKYFDYDVNEKKVKPPQLKSDALNGSKLKMSASQFKCFLQNIPMMIGHKVPDCDEWRYLINAIKIGFWIMKPAYSTDEIGQLRELISDNLSEYMRLFDTHLKPKAHFLTHYHMAITWNGPTKFTSCFIPESKHKIYKKIANLVASRRNIAFTLAFKDQLMLAHGLFVEKSNFGKAFLEPGKGFYALLSSIPVEKSIIFDGENDLNEDPLIEILNYVMLGSSKIKPTTLLIDFAEDEYIFNEIQYIIKIQESIIFICKQYKQPLYDTHIDGYILHNETYTVVKKNAPEISFYPNRLHILPDGRKAIRIKN